jgi:hypothetical protein
VQHLRARSAAEQVHPAPAKLPGARTREEEAHPVGFDDAVHLVEQERQSLDLVDGDGGTTAAGASRPGDGRADAPGIPRSPLMTATRSAAQPCAASGQCAGY